MDERVTRLTEEVARLGEARDRAEKEAADAGVELAKAKADMENAKQRMKVGERTRFRVAGRECSGDGWLTVRALTCAPP